MVVDIVKWTLLSLILIILLHNLYLFFQKTLTIPKTKDLVNRPVEMYEELLNTQPSHSGQKKETRQANMDNPGGQSNKNLSDIEKDNMKKELQNFLNDLGNSKNNSLPQSSNTNLESANLIPSVLNNSNPYSSY